MRVVFSLDIGVASVGSAVIDKETEQILECCSYIFPEASAAANTTRREMRDTKRTKRRKRTRLDDFMKLWEQSGFDNLDVFYPNLLDLKVLALSEIVDESVLCAILYAALKHRGISYLEDAQDDVSGSGDYASALVFNQKELKTKYPCQIQKERMDVYGKYRGMNEIVLSNGETMSLNNVFTISAYRNEVLAILNKQKEHNSKITDEFIEKYIEIFNRKRKYYEGPGNEKSRTDYGKYTTKIDINSGEYITEKNIFEKLIGKCSVYEEELRASAASYTAQEFNVLNDLNNLTINGRKLMVDEKREIVNTICNSDTVNVKKIIEKSIGEKIEHMSGARVDKNDKEIFHCFAAYNKMRKALRDIDVDIKSLDRDQLDEIGHILTINTDKESMLTAFKASSLGLSDEIVECLISVRKKNGQEFNKWHSFSLKIMNELIPEMYETSKEQMALLTEMGIIGKKTECFNNSKYIPLDVVCDELMNPVVKRSVRISIRIINALIKKYGYPEEVVIEMPRDRNTDEQKKRIKDEQKRNDNETKEINKILYDSYNLIVKKEDYTNQKQLALKLKLWNEQDRICLYSGKPIEPKDIIKNPDMFEIDHIIPRSISFDDARTNKVLVYSSENQKKGNQTPYYYLTHQNGSWTYEQFKAKVIELSKKKGISRKKVQNLLFDKDITKIEVLKGFISRNLNDTRYASRVVLNNLQTYFKAKESGTKVKVIRGSYTHQMRVNMKLDKNREESFSHHAVDAMLIAFSQMGYESYRKLQGSFIDFETGEILDERMYDQNMSDDVYKEYLYGKKWLQIRNTITEAEKNVKYWYYVDKKSNRGLCNQTIRGTRQYDNTIYKINKFDIRTKEGLETFEKLAFDKKNLEKSRERLLVYKNDRRTFDDLIKIYNDYKWSVNPFVQYEKETGDYVRKYSKKHNGPIISSLKYTDGEVGTCIDISHKYGYEKDSKKVILESLVPYRMDVYYNENDKLYYFVGVKQSDIKCEKGKYVIDMEAYTKTLINEKMLEQKQSFKDLEKLGYVFKMSFYKNEIIEYEKNGEIYVERFLSRTKPKNKNYIEVKPVEKSKYDKQRLVGLAYTSHVEKIRLDMLGNRYRTGKEQFSFEC